MPSTPDAPDLEAGRLLFAAPCLFVAAAATIAQVPPATAAEVAFAGRSNVGKSSLVNALTGRNTLARVSQTPGRTRQLTFFALGGRLMLVDLPGYGFAKAPKVDVAQWTALTRSYLAGRAVLRRCCLLVDARHGLKPPDLEMMDLLDEVAVSYQIVLTKADKASREDLAGSEASVAAERRRTALHPMVMVTSAQTQAGIPALRAELASLANAGSRS